MNKVARQNIGSRGMRSRLRQPVSGLPSPARHNDVPAPGQSYFAFEDGSSVARVQLAQAKMPDEPPAEDVQPSQDEQLPSGQIPIGVGAPTVMRIPIPGNPGLAIELKPRGYIPGGTSSSTIFFQDIKGRRHLRLDFGYNEATEAIDYHWNVRRAEKRFGIKDHTPVGRGEVALYRGAKYYKYLGRTFVVAGAVLDLHSIFVAEKPLRQTAKVAGGWAGAWAGCKLVGAGGAAVGSLASPVGTALGGIGGCIVGGVGGYFVGSSAAEEAYDWVEETYFEEVPEVTPPSDPVSP